jgi:hypothetical protein
MRESAEALRKRSGRPGGFDEQSMASGEENLARDLGRVAERLGGASAGEQGDSDRLSEELARARQVKDRLTELERRIAEAARNANALKGDAKGQSPAEGRESGGNTQSARQQESEPGSPPGRESGARAGKAGSGQPGESGDKPGSGRELERLRAEYDRELKTAEDLLKRMGAQGASLGGTPEHHEYSISSLGTEAWKQDHSNWDELRRGVHLAIERYESSLSEQLRQRETKDRLNAGGDERLPDEYREMVAKYYQLLAKEKP